MSGIPYDIVVLGGGIGGYTAAIRAAQLGKKTALVEKEKLGGTCLHKGCIPSKALLRSAEIYKTVLEAESFGISAGEVTLNFGKAQERKAKVVEKLHKGVHFLMKKNKIDIYSGNGRIIGPSIFSPRSGVVSIEGEDGEFTTLVPQNVIIATGSRPRSLPGLAVDGHIVMTSNEALEMTELPASIVIVGGGVIGVEWASMLNDFGVEVTIVEYASNLLAAEDKDVSRELERLFKKRGVRLILGAKLLTESVQSTEGTVKLQVKQNGNTVDLHAEKMLVSVGRQANIEGIGIENTDIKTANGFISVNEFGQTSEAHIYAVGDVIGGLQLAHVAAHEGVIAAEHICGMNPHSLSAHQVPKCVYSNPEVASVGITEREAKEGGVPVKVGKFPFSAIGKALVYGESGGFVKVVTHAETNDILGVHMIGPHVTDLIAEGVLAQVLNAAPWEIGQTIHPHPTLSEAFHEAMLDVEGQAIGI